MKSFVFVAAALRAAAVVSANDLTAMEAPADTWCITYLSTYIAAVTNQGDLSPSDEPGNEVPSAQNSGRLPFAPSFRPTFARNTSISITRSAMSTDIGPDSSPFTSDVINTADKSPVSSESSDFDADPTAVQSSSAILTLSNGLSTVVTPTIDAEATSTSTDIIEPAGRNVIFLIQTTDNEKRAFYRRANDEFVGENSPEVCTFAAIFNLAEGQLFAPGQLSAERLPIYYSGEDYKALSAQGRPPRGSVTSEFTDSGGTLAFRNSELPNGEAGFCQDADGRVYITFTTGPSSCIPVSLGIYNVEQCQDGKLVGLDELTSSGSGTITATAEISLSTQSTSGELPESTGLVPSQSTISASQISEFEAMTTESSTQGRADASSQESSTSTVREDVETLSTVSTTPEDPASQPPTASTSQLATETSDLLDSTATSNDGTGLSTTSDVESEATTGIETTDTETTIMTSLSETTVIPETTETTGVDTSSTEVVDDIDTTVATDTTAAIDTTDTITTTEGDTSSTEAVSDIDTTTTDTMDTTTTNDDKTTLLENPTTTEAETTTAEITTTAEPTTTTAAPPEPQPQFACGDPGYTTTYTYNRVTFNLLCARNYSYQPLENVVTANYGECLRSCALNGGCNGVVWRRASQICSLATVVNDLGSDNRFDIAQVASRS